MKLTIEYECGETTCAVSPGKFCRFVRVSHFGRKYHCALFFDSYGNMMNLFDGENGWLERCEDCLKHEELSKKETP